ncbi:endonuclease/exonuclease/phosphatase family protein [Streptomyces sp. NBC_00859]|uniref:endonuclease/exonuclease/phosphatase family protein n=1 Tax=Streptomyces sp. NBC_00859 TaxID=2903682 RepID=UPI0038687FD9|nr:hypothetical protein OG584_04815 [Streptomyces sp. NBC_00859]
MKRLRTVLLGLLLALALSSAATTATASAAGSPSNPDQADGPGILTIEQLNMCMWGSKETPSCFPNTSGAAVDSAAWTAEEKRVAALKRASVATQVSRHIPDVITVSEGCLGDLRSVADTIGYQLAYQETGAGTDNRPRDCTAGRGVGVNAILAKEITGPGPHGYYENPGWRSYLCAQVGTSEWPSVRVCTTHLSLKSQDSHQAVECAALRDDVLTPTAGPTVFAGDVNMAGSGENCAPGTHSGLKDLERSAADQKANPTDGLQHIYYSGFWRQSCGWSYTVENTDHEGFLLELGKSTPAGGLGECWRGIR